MKIKAILFDLDGTLLDTSEFIYQAYDFALNLHKINPPKRKQLAPHIGRDLVTIYKEIAPEVDPLSLKTAHFAFQEQNFHLIETFPNTDKVLNQLRKKKIKIGVVTSRLENTKKTLKAGGLNPDLFDVIISGDQLTKPKPDPQGVFLALKALKVKPSQALMVGDASPDIQMGKDAEVKTVGVTYGFWRRKH